MKLFTKDTKAIAKAEVDIISAAVEALDAYEVLAKTGMECDELEAVANDIAYCRDTIKKTGLKNFFYSLDKENQFADTFYLENYVPGMEPAKIKSLEQKYIAAAEEGFGEAIKSFWEKVKAFFKRIADFVKSLFTDESKKMESAQVEAAKKEVAEVAKTNSALKVKDVVMKGFHRCKNFFNSLFEDDKSSTEALSDTTHKFGGHSEDGSRGSTFIVVPLNRFSAFTRAIDVYFKFVDENCEGIYKVANAMKTRDDVTYTGWNETQGILEKQFRSQMDALNIRDLQKKDEEITLGYLGINTPADGEKYIAEIQKLIGKVYQQVEYYSEKVSKVINICTEYNPYADNSTDDTDTLHRKVRDYGYIAKTCKGFVEGLADMKQSTRGFVKLAATISDAIKKEANK